PTTRVASPTRSGAASRACTSACSTSGGSADALLGPEREVRGDAAAAVRLVDDVDGVVLPVRAGGAEEQRGPAPPAEPSPRALRAGDAELVPVAHEVRPLLLRHTVDVDLVRGPASGRQRDAREFGHRAKHARV